MNKVINPKVSKRAGGIKTERKEVEVEKEGGGERRTKRGKSKLIRE